MRRVRHVSNVLEYKPVLCKRVKIDVRIRVIEGSSGVDPD